MRHQGHSVPLSDRAGWWARTRGPDDSPLHADAGPHTNAAHNILRIAAPRNDLGAASMSDERVHHRGLTARAVAKEAFGPLVA